VVRREAREKRGGKGGRTAGGEPLTKEILSPEHHRKKKPQLKIGKFGGKGGGNKCVGTSKSKKKKKTGSGFTTAETRPDSPVVLLGRLKKEKQSSETEPFVATL